MEKKLKLFELVLMAVSALIAAAKAIVKFIGYVDKIKPKPKSA